MVDTVGGAGVPSAEARQAFWNQWDSTYREGRSLDTLDRDTIRRGRTVLHWIEDLRLSPQARILEIGCANGWMCEQLTRFGAVTGTDVADQVLARAQARLPQVRFIAGDFLTLPFPRGGFDLVVCMETLFCVEDQPRFLARVAELLSPRGVLVLTTHNRFVYERCEDVAPLEPGQTRHWLTWPELRDLLYPFFEVVHKTTLAPAGHRGVLRMVNSYKAGAVIGALIGRDRLERVKERLGFGQSIAVLARGRGGVA